MFPVLMVLMVWRTILVRVRPNELLLFRLSNTPKNDGEQQQQEAEDDEEDESQQRLTSADDDGEEEGGTPPATPEAGLAAWSEEKDDDEDETESNGPEPRRGLWQKVAAVCITCGAVMIKTLAAHQLIRSDISRGLRLLGS